MLKKDFIRIINEEISDFDFLSNQQYQKDKENIDLLNNEDLQKQFICDSLLNRGNVKILETIASQLGGDWEEDTEEASTITLEYYLKIQYTYDANKEPLVFDLQFNDNDGISIGKGSDYQEGNYGTYTPPSGGDWFNYFDWTDVLVSLSSTDGDEIKFTAFEKAPPRIKTLFIREYTESYIENHTGLEIKTTEMKDKVQNIPYC
jgi:hypothetical protein